MEKQHSSLASQICGFLGDAEEMCLAACSLGITGFGLNLAAALTKERLEIGGHLVTVGTPRTDPWSGTAPVSVLDADIIDTFPLSQHWPHRQEPT